MSDLPWPTAGSGRVRCQWEDVALGGLRSIRAMGARGSVAALEEDAHVPVKHVELGVGQRVNDLLDRVDGLKVPRRINHEPTVRKAATTTGSGAS